jgi:hypothetical protein
MLPSVANMPIGNDDYNRVYAAYANSVVPITGDVSSGTVTPASADIHSYAALQSASSDSIQDQISSHFGDLPLSSVNGYDGAMIYQEF